MLKKACLNEKRNVDEYSSSSDAIGHELFIVTGMFYNVIRVTDTKDKNEVTISKSSF